MATAAEQELEAGEKWTKENAETWQTLLTMVAQDAKNQTRPLRLSAYVERLRTQGVSFRNDAAPYVARRLAIETGADMALHTSKLDKLMNFKYGVYQGNN